MWAIEMWAIEMWAKEMWGGLIFYVKQNILSKLVNSHRFSEETEVYHLNLVFINKNWLLLGIYKAPTQKDLLSLNEVKIALNRHLNRMIVC